MALLTIIHHVFISRVVFEHTTISKHAAREERKWVEKVSAWALCVFMSNILLPNVHLEVEPRAPAALNYCQPTRQVTANGSQTQHLAWTAVQNETSCHW